MAECSQSSMGDLRAINGLLVFILNNAASKLPIKQSDMIEVLGKKLRKQFQDKLSEIAQVLQNVYGIVLKEVPNEKSGAKKYICFGEEDIHSMEELQEDQKREVTLLFLILSYIFLMGGTIYEEQLQSFLEGLQIDYVEEHSYFGSNIKKLIFETFVKQLYIMRKKSNAELDVEVKYTLSWGFRAKMEFEKKQVLEVAAKLMDREPEFFQALYIDACGNDENEDATMVE